jgi:hypothetical protein
MVKEQNWPNNIHSRPFSLNVFIIINYVFLMFIYACQSIWLEVSIGIKKVEIVTNLYSLLMWSLQESIPKLWKFITKLNIFKESPNKNIKFI